jgi:hypothetical protein
MLSAVAKALDCIFAHERSRRGIAGMLVAAIASAVSGDLAEARKRDRHRKRRRKKGENKDKDGRCKSRHGENEVLKFIAKAAKKYGQSKKAMERVARCESDLDPCAVNRSGPYYGVYQFLKSTWKTTPYKNRSIWDPEAQALAAAWMWKQGRKDEWACK